MNNNLSFFVQKPRAKSFDDNQETQDTIIVTASFVFLHRHFHGP